MIARLLDYLREQHPFELLNEKEMELVTTHVKTRTFPEGQTILRLGGPISSCLFLIADGSARLAPDELTGRILEEGDFFGFPSIISQNNPTATVTAETQLVAHCIPADIFSKLLNNASFADFFLKDLSERLSLMANGGHSSLGGELTTPVEDLGLRIVVTVSPDDTVAETARAMRHAREDVAIVDCDHPGIITDHDFQVKVLADNLGPETPVHQVMTKDLKTLPSDIPVHSALLYMLEENIHHLPITSEGKIVGLVSATDLLRHQTRNPLFLTRQLEQLDDPSTLAHYRYDSAAMVERLFNGGLKVAQTGRIFASVNQTLVRRLLRLAEKKLGPAPCAYSWLVFGSEGRMEQALITDQDNALVYADSGQGNSEYFGELAKIVGDDLLTAGFPPCPGGYMACNWCKPLDEWVELMSRWVHSPTPESLMMAGIFFDFRSVAGSLSIKPMEDIILKSPDNQIFMAHLARESLRFRPPLNLFRRIQADDGKVDLKTGGIAPIVAAGRVYGLKAGSRFRPTRKRFEAAMDTGLISKDLGQTVTETYRFLLQLRLREQLAVVKNQGTPDNLVLLNGLTSLERRHLKDAFGVIRELQEKVAHRFQTNLLG
ncbi:MAG: CBS domain-containing protein [bacterium]|nr:CBS domain-containing protein [bacterium]